MKHGLSVVICCYNSERRLPETIIHLSNQVISADIPWEIIVVDNNSTDSTSTVARDVWKKTGRKDIALTIAVQKKPGLIFARQKGVEEAKYEFIVFCDDDNWLAENYLSTAFKTISQNARIGALGGIGHPVFEGSTAPPGWFENIRNAYALGPQAPEAGKLANNCHLYGAGMVTRRKLYIDSYPDSFPSLLQGRVAQSLLSGEDTEYCHRLMLQNYDIYYDPSLVFNHYIPKDRLTDEYRNRLLKGTEDAQKELRRFTLLAAILSSKRAGRLLFVIRVAAGFLSAQILGRKSWNYQDVIRSIYYLTQLNFGVDQASKQIFRYYKTLD